MVIKVNSMIPKKVRSLLSKHLNEEQKLSLKDLYSKESELHDPKASNVEFSKKMLSLAESFGLQTTSDDIKDGLVIKVIKYPLIVSDTEFNRIDKMMRFGKEFYNLLNEQQRAINEYNLKQYYLAYPEKLTEKEEKEKQWQEKVAKEVLEGKRLPKQPRIKGFSPIQHRHQHLQVGGADPITLANGCSSVEDLIPPSIVKSKDGKEYLSIKSTYVDMSRFGTGLRNQFPEFNCMPSDFWVPICKQVEKAFKDSRSNKKNGIFRNPQFKKREDDFSLSFREGVDNNIRVQIVPMNGKKYAKVIGVSNKYFPAGFKINQYRKFCGRINKVSIVKEGNRLFLTVGYYETPQDYPKSTNRIGVDIGVINNIQTSAGDVKNLPKEQIHVLEKKKDHLKSIRDRKLTRNSRKYRTLSNRIQKIERKITNIRKYHITRFAVELVKENGVIAIESLNVKNMTKSAKGTIEEPGKKVAQKSGLNKAILRVAPYMLKSVLRNKSKEYNRVLLEVNPAYTSQTCSRCGHVDPENRKTQAEFKCVSCGLEMNADLNASINILRKGEKDQVR